MHRKKSFIWRIILVLIAFFVCILVPPGLDKSTADSATLSSQFVILEGTPIPTKQRTSQNCLDEKISCLPQLGYIYTAEIGSTVTIVGRHWGAGTMIYIYLVPDKMTCLSSILKSPASVVTKSDEDGNFSVPFPLLATLQVGFLYDVCAYSPSPLQVYSKTGGDGFSLLKIMVKNRSKVANSHIIPFDVFSATALVLVMLAFLLLIVMQRRYTASPSG